MQDYIRVVAYQDSRPGNWHARVTIRCNNCSQELAVMIKRDIFRPEQMATVLPHVRRLVKRRYPRLETGIEICECGSPMGIGQHLLHTIAREVQRRIEAGEPLSWDNPATESNKPSGIKCEHCQTELIRTGSHLSCPGCGAIPGPTGQPRGTEA